MTPAPWGRHHQEEFWTGFGKFLVYLMVLCFFLIGIGNTLVWWFQWQ